MSRRVGAVEAFVVRVDEATFPGDTTTAARFSVWDEAHLACGTLPAMLSLALAEKLVTFVGPEVSESGCRLTDAGRAMVEAFVAEREMERAA